MKIVSIVATAISLCYTMASLLLLLITIPKWKESLIGTVGKSFSTLYYLIAVAILTSGLIGIIKQNHKILHYFPRFLGLFVLASLAQMISSTLILLNGRDAAVNACFKWVAFHPEEAPRQPDCSNAVTVSVWVAFSIYLFGALSLFTSYKLVNRFKQSIRIPSFVIDHTLLDVKIEEKLRSPSICSASPMMEEKRESIDFEEKDDTVINAGADLSDRNTRVSTVVDSRPQSVLLSPNRASLYQSKRLSLASDHTLLAGNSTVVQNAMEQSIYTPIATSATPEVEPELQPEPMFQIMPPTLERSHDEYQRLDLGPNPFPHALHEEPVYAAKDKRKSTAHVTLAPLHVRDRRPSDSQLYHPPTIDRRPITPPAFLQQDPRPKSPVPNRVVIPSRKSSRDEIKRELLDSSTVPTKRQSTMSVRLAPPQIRDRRPSDSQLYHPPTIDRRPINPPEFLQNDPQSPSKEELDFQLELESLQDRLSEIVSNRSSISSKHSGYERRPSAGSIYSRRPSHS